MIHSNRNEEAHQLYKTYSLKLSETLLDRREMMITPGSVVKKTHMKNASQGSSSTQEVELLKSVL